MREFFEVADGKRKAKEMTEFMYRSVDNRRQKSPNHLAKIRTPDLSYIEAKDNPPTTTKRGGPVVDQMD